MFVEDMANLPNMTINLCKHIIVLGEFNLHFDSS